MVLKLCFVLNVKYYFVFFVLVLLKKKIYNVDGIMIDVLQYLFKMYFELKDEMFIIEKVC